LNPRRYPPTCSLLLTLKDFCPCSHSHPLTPPDGSPAGDNGFISGSALFPFCDEQVADPVLLDRLSPPRLARIFPRFSFFSRPLFLLIISLVFFSQVCNVYHNVQVGKSYFPSSPPSLLTLGPHCVRNSGTPRFPAFL